MRSATAAGADRGRCFTCDAGLLRQLYPGRLILRRVSGGTRRVSGGTRRVVCEPIGDLPRCLE